MNKQISAKSNILIALATAGLILLASYLLRGTGYGQTVTHLIIAVWFAVQCVTNRNGCCSKVKADDINPRSETAT